MFIALLGEAMVGADKKVVAADVVIVIIRRPMGRHGLGKLSPLQLYSMRELLPGKDGAVMNLGLVKLGGCAREDGFDFALVEALTVAVVEGYVTYA